MYLAINKEKNMKNTSNNNLIIFLLTSLHFLCIMPNTSDADDNNNNKTFSWTSPTSSDSNKNSSEYRTLVAVVTTFVVFFLICVTLALCILMSRRNSQQQQQQQQRQSVVTDTTYTGSGRPSITAVDLVAGLDQSTINSYPMVVIGESRRQIKPGDDRSCPICLTDYFSGDTLKMLPGCLHRYHADCIDPWLSNKATCPICRTSPRPNS